MTFSSLGDQWLPVLVFSVWGLVGNPLVILLILRSLGYHPRAGFLAGTSLAQISEFSFILIAGSVAAGLVNPSAVSLVAFVGVMTIAVSSYFITYNDQVYQAMSWAFDWMAPRRFSESKAALHTADVLLFGYKDMGRAVLPAIKRLTNCYLVVDYDPPKWMLTHDDEPVLYGDGSDELLICFRTEGKLVISTIPDGGQHAGDSLPEAQRSRHGNCDGKSRADAEVVQGGRHVCDRSSVLGGELLPSCSRKRPPSVLAPRQGLIRESMRWGTALSA